MTASRTSHRRNPTRGSTGCVTSTQPALPQQSQDIQGNFFMCSDTVVMSLHMGAALFLGREDIKEDKECWQLLC